MHTKDEILTVIRTHLANALDEVDPATIEPQRSMKDYGANSLDIVEVVSASMRQLRIKVPRAQLKEIRDIQGLVDLLHQTGQEQAAS
jgi:acyl carrier protein